MSPVNFVLKPSDFSILFAVMVNKWLREFIGFRDFFPDESYDAIASSEFWVLREVKGNFIINIIIVAWVNNCSDTDRLYYIFWIINYNLRFDSGL